MKVYGIDKNKNKVEYNVIMTFKGTSDYVIYTDNTTDDKENLRIYSAIYDPKTSLLVREPKTKEELNEVKEALASIII